nr:PD-(D/E)XK nuclease family protein [Streptococcus anginosus]
ESEDESTAASLLALLAREGISSADPDEWTGEGPLTSQQRIASQRVVLSPSRIEAMMDCPLRWFFSSIGAQPRATNAQSVGQIVHELAEV